jgi:hypothetical protein
LFDRSDRTAVIRQDHVGADVLAVRRERPATDTSPAADASTAPSI